jgi:hypothetical protein
MSHIEPPWYFWLAALPLYGTPIYVILWAIHRYNVPREPGKALKGLAAGLGSWIGLTVVYFVVDFIVQPCLENCSRFRTPEGNAQAFAGILIYTLLASVIVWRLHRYGKGPRERESSPAP